MSAVLSIEQLPSGYWHIRGEGPCNWCQPPHWPASEETIREYAFPEAGESFLREVVAESLRLTPERTT